MLTDLRTYEQKPELSTYVLSEEATQLFFRMFFIHSKNAETILIG